MLIYGGIKNTSECIVLLRSSWIAGDVSELSSLILAALITAVCLCVISELYAPLLTDLFLAVFGICFVCGFSACWGKDVAGGALPMQVGFCSRQPLTPPIAARDEDVAAS